MGRDGEEIILNPFELGVAHDHIARKNNPTPLLFFGVIPDGEYKIKLWVKMDTLNEGGSFKDRGSEYFVHKAVNDGRVKKREMIVTASAGNHGKGVARTARDHGLKAVIFMPYSTPVIKVEGIKELGGEVRFVNGTYNDAAREAKKFSDENNVVYAPAYEHSDIIIGQSTVVTEALMQAFWKGVNPDFFVFPFGGGGLAVGGGFALKNHQKEFGKKIFAFGVQAERFNTAYMSFKAGKLAEYSDKGDTIADGIRVPNASEKMLKLALKYIDEMFCVTEEQIKSAIRRVYNSELITDLQRLSAEELEASHGFYHNHTKRVGGMNRVEGAAAAAFGCVFEGMINYGKIGMINGKKELTGVIIASGNNIDAGLLDGILGKS